MPFFTKDFHKYLKNLAANNNREWFNSNKEEYEKHVKIPFESFIGHLILQAQGVDKEIRITPKDAIFRIYRDVRFARNKTPYKTNVSAVISRYGRKNKTHPGIYIQLGVDGLMMASGVFRPETKTRDKIREYIASHLPEFQKILKNKSLKENWGELQGEKNIRIPQELREIQKKEPLIANKAFYVSVKLNDPNIFLDKDLDKLIIKQLKAVLPLAEFLKKAMK